MNEASQQEQLGQEPVPRPPAVPPGQASNSSTPPGKNGKWIVLVIALAVLLAGGAILYLAFVPTADTPSQQIGQPETNQPSAPNTNNQDSEQPANTTEDDSTTTPKTYEISYTNACFSPDNRAVMVGDTVRFVNNSSNDMWPASNDHPTHTAYPEFDPQQSIAPGGSWLFTFTKIGTWGYHDHLRDSCQGSITVQ